MILPKSKTELVIKALEQQRRTRNKAATDKLNPHFELLQVDFKVLRSLYPDCIPQEIEDLLSLLCKGDMENLIPRKVHLNIYSHLYNKHPDIGGFTTLLSLLDTDAITQDQYWKEIEKLKLGIVNDLKEQFREALLITPALQRVLSPHIDTLFFATLFFYDLMWDHFGETFDSSVTVNNSVMDLNDEDKPYDYRSTQLAQYLSRVFATHYSKSEPSTKVNIVIRGIGHETSDPEMVKWVISTLENSVKNGQYPIGFGTKFRQLQSILKSGKVGPDKLVERLSKFNEIEAPTYINMKRKVVAEFCLAIHEVFSYYLQQPVRSFDSKRLKIYHNILLAFEMDNFYDAMRIKVVDNEHKTKRDVATDRLGDLLRGAARRK